MNQIAYDDYSHDYGYNLNDVIIEHNEHYFTYQYESCKSFVDICRDFGLDKTSANISCL